jgi:hypothetical protein
LTWHSGSKLLREVNGSSADHANEAIAKLKSTDCAQLEHFK